MTLSAAAIPTVGTSLGHYLVERVEPLPEIDGTFIQLRHQSGARHLHIWRDDENSGFGVTFPTIPQDDTGVAHILEHIALMGSQRYPVADPFFAMNPRSLSTFMNAMTGSDWTTYPFSTRNQKDFFNLLSVYLDATFFPLLRYESFRQDGHRFEFEQLDDPGSPLKLQGVVYNEMKGAMASPGMALWQAFGTALYPDLTYAYNSGGDPRHIPELTYQQLKAFHATHYHPSNAYFYSYGRLDLRQILGAIEEQVMVHFQAQPLTISVPDQPTFSAPREHETRYPGSDSERGAQLVLAWKLGYSSDARESLRWRVLSDILLGNPAALLTRPLIESGLGSALSDVYGYLDSYREAAFAVGLKGLSAQGVQGAQGQQVQDLILNTLQELVNSGIPHDLIESSLHQFELEQLEVSNAGMPYALRLMDRLMQPWLYGGDPLSALRLHDQIQALRAELARGERVFEEMLRKLLTNPHRVTLRLLPDAQLAEQLEQDEAALVTRLSADLAEEDRRQIVCEAQRLIELQAQEKDPTILPCLSLADIPATVSRPPYETQTLDTLLVARAPQPTSGLTYLDLNLRLPALPDELCKLLGLYAYAVTRSGAAGQDYVALARRIEAYTGGISASVGVSLHPDDVRPAGIVFSLSGKALDRHAPQLVGLLRDLLVQPEFEPKRLEQLLRQRLSALKASVVSSGSAYALRLASAQLSPAGALDEQWTGLSQLQLLRRWLPEDGEADMTALIAQFQQIAQRLRQALPKLCLAAQPEQLNLDCTPLSAVFEPPQPADHPPVALAPHQPQARLTDSPVSFNALAFATVPYTHPDSPALLALASLLTSKYLLKEIREKGGAYGAFAHFEPRRGVFGLTSYRDPHIGRSYQIFRELERFLAGPLTEQDLLEAILDASSFLDPLTSPDNAARLRFYADQAGYTPEVQEAYKARFLALTLEDLRRVAQRYLRPALGAYALISGQDPSPELSPLGLEPQVERIPN